MIQKIDLREDFVLIENQFIDLGKVTHIKIFSRGFIFHFLGGSKTSINFEEDISQANGYIKTKLKVSYYTVGEYLKKRFKPKIITEEKRMSPEEHKAITDKLNKLYPE